VSAQHQVKTAQTAIFPQRYLSAPISAQETGTHQYFGGDDANVVVGTPLINSAPKPFDIMPAISADYYPRVSAETLQKFIMPVRWTLSSLPQKSYAAMIQFGAQSSVTEPSANTAEPILTSIQPSTNTVLALFVAAAAAGALAKKKAKTLLLTARTAAQAGNMRAAYHDVYRGLDELFRCGLWQEVRDALEEICSDRYPAIFGIGTMRFAFSASKRIPDWDVILEKLSQTAQRQKVDPRKAMRGLI
jgi:hypothetical protein